MHAGLLGWTAPRAYQSTQASTGIMPDNLYERDILSWSEHQADLLRCLARGEWAIGIDWEHVVQEIEDVGRPG